MHKNTISIALLVVGVVLLVLGLQEYGAFGSQISRALGRLRRSADIQEVTHSSLPPAPSFPGRAALSFARAPISAAI